MPESELEKPRKKLERDEKGRLLPGQASLNPEGKAPGTISLLSDLKGRLKKLKEESPDAYYKMIDDYWQDKKKRELLIRMIDGNPRNQTDITTGGEKIIPIFNGLSTSQVEHEEDPS